MAETVAVLLLNLGGPDSLDAVKPFLRRLFSDRAIIRIGPCGLLQKPIARLIAHRRAKKVRPRYEMIGGKSPIGEITVAQAKALETELNEGSLYRVFVAMRYCHPSTDEAVAAIKEVGAKRLIVLPLYPQYSQATTGSHLILLERVLKKRAPEIESAIIRDYYDNAGYLNALAGTVRGIIENLPSEKQDQAQILFSAHAIPQSIVDRGDPYQRQTEKTVAGVVERLGIPENRWTLAYQSRSGPVKWIGPGTEAVLRAVTAGGGRTVVMVPVSFVSDHIETLWEMDIQYRTIAEENGATFFRTPALNTRPDFIAALIELVRGAAGDEK
ncbi:MAG: ferrochelatase [Planctomycetota bacterium]|nr:MAG: ferrochelatase [Planctomycetota bacterium]